MQLTLRATHLTALTPVCFQCLAREFFSVSPTSSCRRAVALLVNYNKASFRLHPLVLGTTILGISVGPALQYIYSTWVLEQLREGGVRL